jgi:hypothetical protein
LGVACSRPETSSRENTVFITPLEVAAAVGFGAPLFTLMGVRMTLAHNRKMQLTQLAESAATTIRREKREAYIELLKAHRDSVRGVAVLGQLSAPQKAQVELPRLAAASERFNELLAEIDIVATPEIAALAQELYEATGRCLDVMYETSEHCLDEIAGQPTQAELIACLERTTDAVQHEAARQRLGERYERLRDQIRGELGFLSINPTLSPTPKDLERLRKELDKLG